jgi:broad specificity phosphatase PhoE
MPLIYFIRHGENLANVERVMAYKVVDHPLNEQGERQADALGRWFLDRALGRVYCSPLRRARQTAQKVAEATGAPLVEREELCELNVGELDGKGDSASWALHDEVIARWRLGDRAARFPGGESYDEVFERIERVVHEVIALHPEEDVALVAHGGIFTSVLPRLCVVPGYDWSEQLKLGNTAITILRHQGGQLACERWGALEHLPDELRSGGGIPRKPLV